ncbi:MAG: CusA/CzcA family heavy metal efflux RND transporter [Gammaproteobacteria bacterium]
MIERVIRWSVDNRLAIILMAVVLGVWGAWALRETPVDAIPDLSDVQVIVRTTYPGQAPQVVEDQVTYPLTTAMLSVPGADVVRGYSFFGDSYVYVLFDEDTDLYWARSRVLEYLSQVAPELPAGARPALGPDATGVGWVFNYVLVDRTGRHDVAELRSLQDWFLKYELQALPGVSEVASVGGFVRQYQVVVDPRRLRSYGLTIMDVRRAIQGGNQEVGGSAIEMGEAEYMIRATGYVDEEADLEAIPLKLTENGVPVTVADIGDVRLGPAMRRGIADLNGEGEVAGGIVVMRWGENAVEVIDGVKARLAELEDSLPEGVEVVVTYDRSALIERAVSTLQTTLVEELVLVTVVCAVFLLHLRSTLVTAVTLPLGVLAAFIAMYHMGINANIMSLGGIAIAIGVMVDAAIVMIENLHRHLEGRRLRRREHWETVYEACREVGPALFFSLLVITVSFLPVFSLEAQEGRLFEPLAYTKTFSMAAASVLAITLVPVLMGYFIRGRIRPERDNPVNRGLLTVYRPAIDTSLRFPWLVVAVALALLVATAWPVSKIGSEFMPDLDEGDLMYMPVTLPAVSPGKARQILQQTDRLISTVPEVETVFGKMGRADTATDPAPLTMIETVIQLKPRDQWREGLTLEDLKAELNRIVNFPGLTNSWVMPIKTRIDMLATGIRTPVGVKIAGPELSVIQDIGEELERVIREVPGTSSVYAERVMGGRYLTVDVDRRRAARHGMNMEDVHAYVAFAMGGANVSESVEGRERYPINLRYFRDWRDSVEQIRDLPLMTESGGFITLSDVADVRVEDGPGMIKSEAARLNGWVYVDIAGRDLGSYVEEARQVVAERIELPPGYSLAWSGQYEYLMRAKARLFTVVPATLAIIVLLLYLHLRRMADVLIVLGTLPLALVGGYWLLYLLDYQMSVAVAVGFIALAGMAAEMGVVLLLYLTQAWNRFQAEGRTGEADLLEAVREGALRRVRPIVMTILSTLAGLLPVMLGTGTGSEVTRRIAAPMVGGVLSITLLTALVVPAVFLLWNRFLLRRQPAPEAGPTAG